jgi:hypothetical protein
MTLADNDQARIVESIENIVGYLTGVLNDIRAGTYTREMARRDAECLIYHEGIDFISAISEYADSDDAPSGDEK